MNETLTLWTGNVLPEWVDYNGHMNDAEYARVFSNAVDALMEHIELDEAGRQHHLYTLFTLENHIKYLAEAHQGAPLQASILILDRDAKRVHLWIELKDDSNQLLATSEQMIMGMSNETRRPAPFPLIVEEKLANMPHASFNQWPKGSNTLIGIRRKNQ
ncbi:hypothetical protein EH196_08095 [Bacillus sp. C1-1]|nr:hypothetical protein EH196_08095 [Bacillus sp. C1-1]